jgi:signal transduction histidine kinase
LPFLLTYLRGRGHKASSIGILGVRVYDFVMVPLNSNWRFLFFCLLASGILILYPCNWFVSHYNEHTEATRTNQILTFYRYKCRSQWQSR